MKSCFIVWCLGLFLVLDTARAAEGPPAPPDLRKPGTVKMAALLERLAQQANSLENIYLNRERVAALRVSIAFNPGMTNSAKALFNFATDVLNAGENDEALELFKRVETLSRVSGEWEAGNAINIRLNQALCYLRMAEQRNCLSNHNADSCLLPIRGGGVHLWQEGSRQAIGVLTDLLQEYPESLAARWLLNVAAMTVGDYPDKVPARWLIPPAAFDSDYDIKRFWDVAGPAGLAVNERSGGSAAEDFDGDGLLDVMVTSIGLRDQMHFFHNNGDGTFSERTRAGGPDGIDRRAESHHGRLQQRRVRRRVCPARRVAAGGRASSRIRCCGTTATARSRT